MREGTATSTLVGRIETKSRKKNYCFICALWTSAKWQWRNKSSSKT